MTHLNQTDPNQVPFILKIYRKHYYIKDTKNKNTLLKHISQAVWLYDRKKKKTMCVWAGF